MKINISEKSQDLLVKFVLVIILYLVFAKPVFDYLGITKSKGDRIRAKQLSDPNSCFKTEFWKKYYQHANKTTGKKLSLALSQQLQSIAKEIYEAFGYWTDDESKISGAIYRLKTKAEVSIMASYFQNAYHVDLLTYLSNGKDTMPQNGLGDYELQIIINYVDKLPNS